MKKTSVEFLIKEFSDIIGPLDTKPMQDLLMMDAMKMAKAMEKEHNEYFFNCGRNYRYRPRVKLFEETTPTRFTALSRRCDAF